MSEAYVTVTQLRLCVLATVRSELIFKIGMLKHTKSFEVNFLFQLDFKLTVVYASSMLEGRLMSFLIRMCSFVKDELEYFFHIFRHISIVVAMSKIECSSTSPNFNIKCP